MAPRNSGLSSFMNHHPLAEPEKREKERKRERASGVE